MAAKIEPQIYWANEILENKKSIIDEKVESMDNIENNRNKKELKIKASLDMENKSSVIKKEQNIPKNEKKQSKKVAGIKTKKGTYFFANYIFFCSHEQRLNSFAFHQG